MKYLLLIILAGAGYYAYTLQSTQNITVDSYQALIKKVEKTEVTLQEVKSSANMLAEFFCNDAEFQKSGGSSSRACINKLNNYREMCESRIFNNQPDTFNDKEQVISLAKSFTSCTGSKG